MPYLHKHILPLDDIYLPNWRTINRITTENIHLCDLRHDHYEWATTRRLQTFPSEPFLQADNCYTSYREDIHRA